MISEGKELLASYPDSENNSEVYRIMGNAYYHLGNEDQAINMLSKYVSSTDSPLRAIYISWAYVITIRVITVAP